MTRATAAVATTGAVAFTTPRDYYRIAAVALPHPRQRRKRAIYGGLFDINIIICISFFYYYFYQFSAPPPVKNGSSDS